MNSLYHSYKVISSFKYIIYCKKKSVQKVSKASHFPLKHSRLKHHKMEMHWHLKQSHTLQTNKHADSRTNTQSRANPQRFKYPETHMQIHKYQKLVVCWESACSNRNRVTFTSDRSIIFILSTKACFHGGARLPAAVKPQGRGAD